jgi:dTDP-4-amino-4,6-dideoxygalactose transaminase
MTEIAFVNLKAQHERLKPEIMGAISTVLEDRAFIQGRHATNFARAFCDLLGLPHATGCSNGTAAIAVALEALGVGRGDEVITVSHTFFATTEAIFHVGATPVFVDIDPRTYTIDLAQVEAAITPRTRAVLPVHLYGNPCQMTELMALAHKHGLVVVEDAAQAHLATYGNTYAGAFGDAATFSFYPGKNLGALGDAGLVATRDETIAKTVASLVDHGRSAKYEHDRIGYNYRLDGLQAAILSAKLPHLPGWTARRRAAASRYDSILKAVGFKVVETWPGGISSYHLYPVEVSNRDETMRALHEAKIGCGIHYPVPIHLQPAVRHLGFQRGQLPHTERAADRVLSLPMCAELRDDEVDRVCEVFLGVACP